MDNDNARAHDHARSHASARTLAHTHAQARAHAHENDNYHIFPDIIVSRRQKATFHHVRVPLQANSQVDERGLFNYLLR